MGFNTLKKEKICITVLGSQVEKAYKELESEQLPEAISDVNPGVLGCGILIGNLGETSQRYFKEMLEVINIYQNSTMFGKYPEQLKFEFEIEI